MGDGGRLPVGIPVASDIHLGEEANVADAVDVNGVIAEEVDDCGRLRPETEEEHEGRDDGGEQFLQQVNGCVGEQLIEGGHGLRGVRLASPVRHGEVVDVGDDGRQEFLGAEHHVLVGDEDSADGDDGAQAGHQRERVLYVENVLVPNGEDNERGENGAGDEGHILSDHDHQRRDEEFQVLVGRLVRPVQPRPQLVIELVEVSQMDPAVLTPLPHPQTPRLPFDDLHVVEEAMKHLPDEDERHEKQVEKGEQRHLVLELLHQLLLLARLLELVFEMELVERRPWTLKEEELQVVFEPFAEKKDVADERDEHANRQQVLVHHGHHVVLVTENAMIDVQLGELGLVDAHGVLVLRHNQPLLDFMPANGVELVVRDLESDIVKGLNVPKLEEVVEGGEGAGSPKHESEEKAYPSWERKAGDTLILNDVTE